MNERDTGTTVTYRVDSDHPSVVDAERWARLKAMPDEQIDYSDLPAQDSLGWKTLDRSRFAPAGNEFILEGDILEFFRRKGDASSERINAVLREYVEAHRDAA